MLEKIKKLFQVNTIITDSGQRYVRPAPKVYQQQWLWDSCFHAMVSRHFDPDLAQAELLAIVEGQVQDGGDRGLLPHMQYWAGGGKELWQSDSHSQISQPILLAQAALSVWQKTADQSFLKKVFDACLLNNQWWEKQRHSGEDALLCIIHPWESGWDASPRFDQAMGLKPYDEELSKQARHALAGVLKSSQYSLSEAIRHKRFAVKPVDFNAIYLADLESQLEIAEILKESKIAEDLKAQIIKGKAAFEALFWDKAEGLYQDYDLTTNAKIQKRSLSGFISLYAGIPNRERSDQQLAILLSSEFLRPWGLSTSSATASDYQPELYWRGNIWPSVTWLIWKGLRRYGYFDVSRKVALQFANLIEQQGLHEYFNPETGEGYGPDQQSWAGVVLDMMIEEQLL